MKKISISKSNSRISNSKLNSKILKLSNFLFLTISIFVVSKISEASSSSMPWDGPLQKLLDNITGPVARTVAILAVVVCMIGLIFGAHGGIVQKLIQIAIAIAIIFAAVAWVPTFFGFSGSILLI
ncbi:MAG: TrbC/VirB2 family protein [Fusobacteriaceae bacterium]|jgi:type IV secretion system protein VirB2|nr:TrbC/VirB2 family protein [Fusobacteriaceae bacterium]